MPFCYCFRWTDQTLFIIGSKLSLHYFSHEFPIFLICSIHSRLIMIKFDYLTKPSQIILPFFMKFNPSSLLAIIFQILIAVFLAVIYPAIILFIFTSIFFTLIIVFIFFHQFLFLDSLDTIYLFLAYIFYLHFILPFADRFYFSINI